MLTDDTPVDDATVDVTEIDTEAVLDATDDTADSLEETPDETTANAPTDAEGAEASAQVTATAQQQQPVTEQPPPTPFAFKAFGQDYPIPGTRWEPEKKLLQFEDQRAFDRVRQLLSHGREWEHRGRQELIALRKEVQQRRDAPVAQEDIVKAQTYLEEVDRLMSLDEESLFKWCMNARVEWPLLRAKAQTAYNQRILEQAQAAQQPPEPDVEVIVEEVRNETAQEVQKFLQTQAWATPEIRDEILEHLHDTRTLNLYVMRATRDMPEQGIRKGQYVINWDDVHAILDRFTKPYRRAHELTATHQATAAQKVQQTQTIAAQNGKALAQAKPKPAAPPASTQRAPATERKMTTEEVRAKIDRDMDRAWREMRA